MKKGILFSMFVLLSVAVMAQHSGGCGYPEDYNSNTAAYTAQSPVASLKADFIRLYTE